jgi:hypothetical protein
MGDNGGGWPVVGKRDGNPKVQAHILKNEAKELLKYAQPGDKQARTPPVAVIKAPLESVLEFIDSNDAARKKDKQIIDMPSPSQDFVATVPPP